MGVYYPKSVGIEEMRSPYFDTLDQCKVWIDGNYASSVTKQDDDAGCGMNCAKGSMGVYECHGEFVHYLHP